MASYILPFNITNGMLTPVSSISEKVGKISVTRKKQLAYSGLICV